MKLIDIKNINFKTCVTIGYFDGVHIGHRKVIKTCIECAGKTYSKSLVVLVCDSVDKKEIINTLDERKHLISELEPDYLAVIEDVNMSVKEIIKLANADTLVCGNNFDFEDLDGNVNILRVDDVLFKNEYVDFSLVKRYLNSSETELLTEVLGSPYIILGDIIHGKGMGRTVGMPTANLDFSPHKILIKNGVYFTKSTVGNKKIDGLTSLGRRPAVDDEKHITVETFMLGFDKMIYGETVILEFLSYIRPIFKLPGLQAVRDQLNYDIKWVEMKNFLNRDEL